MRLDCCAEATEATESICEAKDGLAETTPMPPICGSRRTIVPPAAATSWSTFAGSELEAKATV